MSEKLDEQHKEDLVTDYRIGVIQHLKLLGRDGNWSDVTTSESESDYVSDPKIWSESDSTD